MGILSIMRRTALPVFFSCIALLLAATAARGAKPVRAEVAEAAVNFTAVQPGQQAVVAVVLDIKPGFHAQSHTPSDENYIKFEAKPPSNPAIHWLDPIYPAGQKEHYAELGDLNVYTGRITIYIPFEVKEDAAVGDLKMEIALNMQICDEKVCYAPQTIVAPLATLIVAPGQKIEPSRPELFKGFDPAIFSHSRTKPAAASGASSSPGGSFKILGHELKDTSYGLAFFAAFVVGIIFNAVPCVLPVVPLKAIGFYEVSQHNRGKCLAFGAVFSAGIIATFAGLALLVVVYQKVGWGELYSNRWFTVAIVVILLVMAIGTFGVFSVNLPPAVYSVTPRHDTYLGNFLFGILTAILSTPCTFGMFLGLLVWASKQTPLIGTTLVMTVGAGMAFPYLVLSAFPELARRIPRAGPWAELIKQMMGFLLLGSAVFFAQRFLQPFTGPDNFYWLIFAVVVAAATFLVVRGFSFSTRAPARLICVCIAVLMVAPSFVVARALANQPYQWTPYTAKALTDARASGRVVVVEFTASWCSTCHVLEKRVLDQPVVVADVKKRNVEMIRADLTYDDATGWPLLKRLSPIAAVPFTAVYLPGQDEPLRLSGIYSIEDFRGAIDGATAPTALAQNP